MKLGFYVIDVFIFIDENKFQLKCWARMTGIPVLLTCLKAERKELEEKRSGKIHSILYREFENMLSVTSYLCSYSLDVNIRYK